MSIINEDLTSGSSPEGDVRDVMPRYQGLQ